MTAPIASSPALCPRSASAARKAIAQAGAVGIITLQLSIAIAQSEGSAGTSPSWPELQFSESLGLQALARPWQPPENVPPPAVRRPRGPGATPTKPPDAFEEPPAYVDRLLFPTGISATMGNDDQGDDPDPNGLPRAIRVELQHTRTLNNGNVVNGGTGIGVRGFLDTANFGSVSAELQTGANRQLSAIDSGAPGAVRPFTFTLLQQALPLAGGWSANNALGIVPPVSVGLIRQQSRFSLPSRVVEGATTELLSAPGKSGAAFSATLGNVGQLEGFPISGFRHQGGHLAQAGAQVTASPGNSWLTSWLGPRATLTTAVAIIDVRGAPDVLGVGNSGSAGPGQLPGNAPTAKHDSVFIAQRIERDGVTLQANGVHSISNGSGNTLRGNGWWIDGTVDDGRMRHTAGVFQLGTGINWGGLAMNSDVQGGYYRFQYQTLRWSGDAAIESLRSVSGVSSPGQYASGDLRYRVSRDLSVGGGGAVRTYSGRGTQAFAYAQSMNALGATRGQIDVADASAGNRSQGITLDHNWNALGSIRLGTSLNYTTQQVAQPSGLSGTPQSSKRDTLSWALNGGGYVFDNLSFNLNVQARRTLSGPVDDALYVTAGLIWNLNRAWSLSANATSGTGRYVSNVVSLDPLAAPVEEVARPNQRSYLFVLRYEDRAGTPVAPLGGRIGSGGGEIAGFVYFDANANNIRDASEPGVPNVVVVLDGKFSTRTDQQGRFNFPFVAAGDHAVSVIADNLPLPWQLINEGMTKITVSPRRNETVNIPAVRNQ